MVPSGRISEEKLLLAKRAGVDTDETTIAGFVEHSRDEFLLHFENYAFSRALEVAWSVIARVDKMISEAKPWDLAKDANQKETLNAILYRAAETLRWLCVLLHPVMPEGSSGIYAQLGFSEASGATKSAGSLSAVDPTALKWGGLREGARIGEVRPLFPRLDKGKVMSEIKGNGRIGGRSRGQKELACTPLRRTLFLARPTGTDTKASPPMQRATEADAVPATDDESTTRRSLAVESESGPERQGLSALQGGKAASVSQGGTESISDRSSPSATEQASEGLIDISDFAKVELRVGEVLTAERIPKADKLLLLTVDVGEEKPRQILAGIAQHYEPSQLSRAKDCGGVEPQTAQAARLRVARNVARCVGGRGRETGNCHIH